jgi:hypothetical protein
MPKPALILALLSASLCTLALGQAGSKAAPVSRPPTPPVYRVSFERRKPVEGVMLPGLSNCLFNAQAMGLFSSILSVRCRQAPA